VPTVPGATGEYPQPNHVASSSASPSTQLASGPVLAWERGAESVGLLVKEPRFVRE